jgi:3-isopropylmalate dehydratase small subunit
MVPVSCVAGSAAPYPGSNVDTDEIVPARYLYRERRAGFADTLFHDLRFDETGRERADFVLNRPEYRGAKILVTGQNFGCGSSREHAVWALLDYGIACVIAVSFGEIFRNNALENGLLPVVLADEAVAELHRSLARARRRNITIDLEAQRVTSPTGATYHFEIDYHAKRNLQSGCSKIDATLARIADIDSFERRYRKAFPWAV